MTGQKPPVRRALSGTQDAMADHGGDRSESGGPTAGPGIEPANTRMIASDAEVEQPETLPPTTTRFPYDLHFPTDNQATHIGKQCPPWCSCACHSRTTFLVPSPFGTLSGSFSGLPLLTGRCAEHACKRPTGPSGCIAYRFPSWFWDRLLAISMKTSPVCGPEINIRFPRMVMPSKLYLFALHGETKRVQSLFTEGAASPWDVNNHGSTALYVSHKNFTLASFPCFLWWSLVGYVKSRFYSTMTSSPPSRVILVSASS